MSQVFFCASVVGFSTEKTLTLCAKISTKCVRYKWVGSEAVKRSRL